MDLLLPIAFITPVLADASGVATLSFTLPANVTLADYHTQGIVVRGAGGKESIKTRPLWADIR